MKNHVRLLEQHLTYEYYLVNPCCDFLNTKYCYVVHLNTNYGIYVYEMPCGFMQVMFLEVNFNFPVLHIIYLRNQILHLSSSSLIVFTLQFFSRDSPILLTFCLICSHSVRKIVIEKVMTFLILQYKKIMSFLILQYVSFIVFSCH